MKNFLDRLEIVRGNLSVSAFAKACGVNQKTMDHLVKDERKPSVEVVISVCRAFGVSADWLLGLTDERTPPRGGTHHTATNSPGAVVGDGNAVSPDAAALADLQRRVAALERRR